MRILVTGVAGQLGYDICRELKERGYKDVVGIDKEQLDITDKLAVEKYIENLKPDVIMHNAAWTAVDLAEDCPDMCYNINVLGTKYIAQSAEKIGAKLVYISTDYVFDGSGEKFFEVDDTKSPLSVYGKTKFEGEHMAQLCTKHFIVRISWVFGINGKNFVKTMLKLAETKNEVNVVCDQIGSPTYTHDLSKLLCDMIETDKFGIYHATNEGTCSWFEFAKAIYNIANINIKVNPVLTSEYGVTKAARPLNSRLSKSSLDNAGFKRLPSWQNALERFFEELTEELETNQRI